MTIQDLQTLHQAEPFQPFTMHLADGRQIVVSHPEFMFLPPVGRRVIVYKPDGTFHLVDLRLVTDLEVMPNGEGPSGGG